MIKDSVANQLSKIAKFCGVDRAVAYTITAKGFQVIAGPITLLLIANYLSPSEQGFYYTFASIVNLQIFFELGLSYVILQFASHEKAALTWGKGKILIGDDTAKDRLASLLRLSIKWYALIAILAILILIPVGISFLSTNKSLITVPWKLPWILVVFSTGTMLFLSPVLSFLEGCGLVTEIASMRVSQTLFSNLFLWSALVFKTSLFAAAVPSIVGIIWSIICLYSNHRFLLIDLLKHKENKDGITKVISWRHEIFPLQWKIAVSALSGYFIFSLFTPVLFRFHGPIMAGKMGMSLSLTNAITTFAMSWVSTKMAPFGNLIAAKKYLELNNLFFPALKKSMVASILSSIILLFIAIYLKQTHHPFGLRIIDLLSLTLLLISINCNVYVFGLATYLRAHKKEPYLELSIFVGVLTGISTYFLGRDYGVIGMSVGYCLVNLTFSVIVGTLIFNSKRRQWHNVMH